MSKDSTEADMSEGSLAMTPVQKSDFEAAFVEARAYVVEEKLWPSDGIRRYENLKVTKFVRKTLRRLVATPNGLLRFHASLSNLDIPLLRDEAKPKILEAVRYIAEVELEEMRDSWGKNRISSIHFSWPQEMDIRSKETVSVKVRALLTDLLETPRGIELFGERLLANFKTRA